MSGVGPLHENIGTNSPEAYAAMLRDCITTPKHLFSKESLHPMANQSNEKGTPFKCLECNEVVTTDTGKWPKECPHCGSKEWMTTMDAIDEQKSDALKDEDVPRDE